MQSEMLVELTPSREVQCSSVQLLSHVLFAAPWTAACQASLSIINSRSLHKLMSITSGMPSKHLILYCPLLLPSIFPSIRVFSNELDLRIRWPKYWSFQLQHQSFQWTPRTDSALKRNELSSQKKPWRNLKCMSLSERRQAETGIHW